MILRYLSVFTVLFLNILLSGCVHNPHAYSQEEWTNLTTRKYQKKSSIDIQGAAEQLLKLADESDVKIYKWPDRLLGQRRYSLYMVLAAAFGTYSFDLQLKEDTDSTRVTLLITHSGGSVSGAPMGASPMMVSNSSGGVIIDEPEVYNLFFARLDSLLAGAKWQTCKEVKNQNPESNTGAFDALCIVADDHIPGVTYEKKVIPVTGILQGDR